jgi:phage gp29-like protein
VRRPDTRELAVATIRDRWSDYPSSGLTPQKLAAIFKEADQGDVRRQSELFEEMEEKDPHLASQFQIRKLAVQGLEYEVSPRGNDSTAKKIADFCDEVISGMEDWDDHILDFLDALAKGYSMHEILWDANGRENRIRGLRWVHSKKITFYNSLTPRVITEEHMMDGIDPPAFKFAYHRYKARSGYDTRAGILRVCGWMYLFKNYDIKDWVAFAEVYGMPLRVGRYEPGASPEDKRALITAIRSLGSDAAGIISKSTEIEFVEAQKYGSINVYEGLARFCDAQMSKAILGQTLTSEASGEGGSGSRALGEVHNEVRGDLVKADCKALAKTIRQQILRPLVGFNYGWDAPVPQFRFLCEESEDLKELADVYAKLWNIGFDVSQEHISERFQVPIRQESETPLSRQPQGGAPADQGQAATAAKRIAKDPVRNLADPDDGQLSIDDLADRLAAGGTELDPMLQPVVELVTKASSYEEIMEKLYGLYSDMDPEKFQELLHRASFAADLWGTLRARKEAGE